MVLCAQVAAADDPDCDIRHRESGGAASRLQVKAGERFSVCLAANRSTGYLWALPFEKSEGLERLIYLGTRYRPGATAAKGHDGVPGSEIFHFAAAQPGTVKLALEYVRPWLWHEAPAGSVVLEIAILPKPER
jgi:predicted secreted protein